METAATAVRPGETRNEKISQISGRLRSLPEAVQGIIMKRILCLDVGDARIGVAVSDETRTIASPVEVIHRVGWGPDCRKIKAICDQYGTDEVLSGLPLNMDGSEGFQAKKVREFCAQVEKQGLKVCFQDERLSTVAAEDALIEGGMSRADRKGNVDKVAAAVILQEWLDGEKKKTHGGTENGRKF